MAIQETERQLHTASQMTFKKLKSILEVVLAQTASPADPDFPHIIQDLYKALLMLRL